MHEQHRISAVEYETALARPIAVGTEADVGDGSVTLVHPAQEVMVEAHRSLAARDLQRGLAVSLPSGEALARFPGTPQVFVAHSVLHDVQYPDMVAEVADFLQAATIAVVGEVTIDRLFHAVPAFPTRSEVWLYLLEALGIAGPCGGAARGRARGRPRPRGAATPPPHPRPPNNPNSPSVKKTNRDS